MLEKYYGNFRAETGEGSVVLSCLCLQYQKEQMYNQCNPDLSLDGVLALPVEAFDAEVLLYLLEVQLNLPLSEEITSYVIFRKIEIQSEPIFSSTAYQLVVQYAA